MPRGPAPFASFDSIASIDVTTPEDRNTPAYQGTSFLKLIHIVDRSLTKLKYRFILTEHKHLNKNVTIHE